jgi:hypothetical protein
MRLQVSDQNKPKRTPGDGSGEEQTLWVITLILLLTLAGFCLLLVSQFIQAVLLSLIEHEVGRITIQFLLEGIGNRLWN